MKKQLLALVAFVITGTSISFAQNRNIFDPDSLVKKEVPKEVAMADSIKKSQFYVSARPFPLRDANPTEIRFFHRYWRDIDLTEKKNEILIRPGATLIEALLNGLKDGRITAYDPNGGPPDALAGDTFIAPMSYDYLMSQLQDSVYVDQFDKDGNKTGSVAKLNPFTPDKIVGFRIKEDVFFDRQRAHFTTMLIGIAPLQKLTTSSGDSLGIVPLCWFKYKDCRKVFVTMNMTDPNKKLGYTMDDVFLERHFKAKIVEESNPLNARIKDYALTPDAQDKEALRLENKLTVYKNSLFTYTLSSPDEAPPVDTNAKKAVPKKNTPPGKPVSPK